MAAWICLMGGAHGFDDVHPDPKTLPNWTKFSL
jgi:hypothetical protein